MTKMRTFLIDSNGATAIEYALIAGSVALAIVAGATTIGTKLTVYFSKAGNGLS